MEHQQPHDSIYCYYYYYHLNERLIGLGISVTTNHEVAPSILGTFTILNVD